MRGRDTVPQATSSPEIQALIQGEITGQVAVGTQIVQIGSVHGGVVNLAPQPAVPRARPLPVYLRPRPFPQLLDRESEVQTVSAAFGAGMPVEIHGPAGIGKTTLLRYLSHYDFAPSFPDGIIYLSARAQPAADVLQSLYEAFYEADVPFKPTDAQIRLALRERRALAVIDDVEFPREELERLMDAAPACIFLVASPERRLWGEVRAVAARGLPDDAALALVERALEAPLTADQRETARALCAALEGHPLRILQAVALARMDGRSLVEVAAGAKTTQPSAGPEDAILEPLTDPEHRALAVLAVLRGAAVEAPHIGAIAEVSDIDAVLERLVRRGLVQAHSPRYSVTPAVADAVARRGDLAPWVQRTAAYFTAWTRERRKTPERVLSASVALVALARVLAQRGRWSDALNIAQATEGAVALQARWGAWAELLGVGLEASKALNDPGAQAWALHQLGTRAMCLGDQATAGQLLGQALKIREAHGDLNGAAVTRHNLNILNPPPTPEPPEPPPEPTPQPPVPPPRPILIVLAKALAVALPVAALLTGVGLWYLRSRQEPGALTVNTHSLRFGEVELGTTSPPREITLTNTGARPVRVRGITLSGAGRDYAPADDTCSNATVPPEGTCSVQITFAPSEEGERTATLTVEPEDGDPQTVEIGGTGAAPRPVAEVGPQELVFPPQQAGTSGEPQEITVMNAGRGPLRLGAARLSGANAAAFEKVADECSHATLDGGGRCRVTLRFAPAAPGDLRATFEIESNADGSPHSVALHGSAEVRPVASLRLSPQRLDFGAVRIGDASRPRTLTVTNAGTAPLRIRSIAIAGPHGSDYAKTSDACTGATIPPGGSCRLTIVFRPTGAGARQAVITFDSNAEGSPHVLRLGGTDVRPSPTAPPPSPAAGTLGVEPQTLDFGSQEIGVASAGRTLTVTNTGPGPLRVRRTELGGVHAIDFTRLTDRCAGVTLAPGNSCTITFAFRPSIGGERSAFVTILATDMPLRVPLRGLGAVVAALDVRPQELDFGEQETGSTSPARTITLVNSGGGSLLIRRIPQGGDHAADFARTGDSCTGTSLGPQERCTITLRFTPQREGVRQAFLTVLTANEQRRIGLTGTGAAVRLYLEVMPSALDFGEQQVGSSSRPRSVRVRNGGSRSLTGIRTIVTGSDFFIDDRCGAVLDAAQTCVVAVTFSPRAAGRRTAAVVIQATGGQATVTLGGTGVVARGMLVVHPSSVTFGEQTVKSRSRPRVITVANEGAGAITIRTVSVEGSEHTDFQVEQRCLGATLNPGGSCQIGVSFVPRDRGPRSATIVIATDDGRVTAEVSGTGSVVETKPVLDVQPTVHDFGIVQVGNQGVVPVRIANPGSAPLEIQDVFLSGGDRDQFPFENRCVRATITPQTACEFRVFFRPRRAGRFAATLQISAGSLSSTIRLAGSADEARVGVLTLRPSDVGFGTVLVGESKDVRIVATNTGSAPLDFRGLDLSGPAARHFRISHKCGLLQPGDQCLIVARFAPGSIGNQRVNVTIVHDGQGQRDLQLAGTGVVQVRILPKPSPSVVQ